MNARDSPQTTVVNVKHDRCDIYIGRLRGAGHCHFGNPFVIGRDGNREAVIAKYKEWLTQDTRYRLEQKQFILDNLYRLKGHKLGCFCKPDACHGDVLVELINTTQRKDQHEN